MDTFRRTKSRAGGYADSAAGYIGRRVGDSDAPISRLELRTRHVVLVALFLILASICVAASIWYIVKNVGSTAEGQFPDTLYPGRPLQIYSPDVAKVASTAVSGKETLLCSGPLGNVSADVRLIRFDSVRALQAGDQVLLYFASTGLWWQSQAAPASGLRDSRTWTTDDRSKATPVTVALVSKGKIVQDGSVLRLQSPVTFLDTAAAKGSTDAEAQANVLNPIFGANPAVTQVQLLPFVAGDWLSSCPAPSGVAARRR